MTDVVDCCEEERRASLRRRPRKKQTAGDRWEARIKCKYGIDAECVAVMWALQDGKCPICGVDLTTKRWVVDHDHRTGRFRGILDAWCNHRIVSMAERGGFTRAFNVLRYLWGRRAA